MSVYTAVSQDQLKVFLKNYQIGNLISYEGIADGITNSNYWLETEKGSFVLTLYEHHQDSDLDYILGLQNHLINQGVACASPVADINRGFYARLNGKPAAINRRVKGEVSQVITVKNCEVCAMALAKFHLAGISYPLKRQNPCGNYWRVQKQKQLSSLLNQADAKLLAEEIQAYRLFDEIDLPGGPVHADLFHDNCLFDAEEIGGIIDFDYACNDFWLYDIAITVNDWCSQEDGRLDVKRLQSFLDSYHRVRPILEIEYENLALMLRLAAVRFWLSRLYDQKFPLSGELTFIKDPDEFKNILLLRRENIATAEDLFTDTKA